MNYSKIYYKIIENRKNNPYDGYTESHHIVPKSLGGTDDKNNLVNLTAREHFVCHLLLTKMYYQDTPNYYKMVKAFMMMLVCKSENQERFLTSKKYEFLKTKFSKAQSISQSGSNNSQYGKPRSEEVKNKIRETWLKKTPSKRKNKKLITAENRKKEIDLYRKYLIIYEEFGFKEFVNKTGYDKTQPNLVQRFRKLIPEFKSQNGKRRGLFLDGGMVNAPDC